jgi:uncharacterized protein
MAFLGNANTREFHDLTKTKAQCQISQIIAHAHDKTFTPDTIEQAIREGYEPCAYCLGTFGDLLIGATGNLASPADLTGHDLGDGRVSLSWTYPEDAVTQNVRFDVYASTDPLRAFRTLLVGDHGALAATVGGFEAGGDWYFTVVARRGAQLSLPSGMLRLFVPRTSFGVPPSGPGGGAPGAEAPGFPFRIDGAGRVFGDGGDSLLRGKILQLLLTAPGERVNLPEFGTRLRDLVFDPNNEVLAAATEFAVNRALQRFLGDEVHVDTVQVASHEQELLVEIVYLRKADLNSERLRVGIPIPR